MSKKSEVYAQKAAAVVIALGSDNASGVYKYLREDEIEQISLEIAKMERMSGEQLNEIMEDFYGLCVTKKVISEGGVEYAKDVLEKAFGSQMASSLMDRVSKSLKTKAFDYIRKADSKNLINLLQNEHPQTIALVLSYARADQASEIISELPSELRVEVIERIAKLDRASPDILKIVEKTLEKKVSSIISVDLIDMGGVNYIADIMNHVDRGIEKHIFDELTNKDPQLAE
ncbi:MAG: flagellar motor switch protein FliG, partial [Angelakisella sp.]